MNLSWKDFSPGNGGFPDYSVEVLPCAGGGPAACRSRDFMRLVGGCDPGSAHGRQNAALNGRNQR